MYTSYLACDLGTRRGRISLGTLDKGRLTISNLRRFKNAPTRDQDGVRWDIPELFQHVTDALTEVARSQETVNGVSCTSWGEDYLLFDEDGAVMMPVGSPPTKSMVKSHEQLLSKLPAELMYQETGAQPSPFSTLVQLAAEKGRRLAKAGKLLPVADAFNFLLSGEARVEASSASSTHLYNPRHRGWSARIIHETKLPVQIFPQVVPAGTVLGPLREEIAEQTGIEDVDVVTSCSNDMAATLAGLPAEPGESWAYLHLGTHSTIGTELPEPLLTETALASGFTNEVGYAGTARFSKASVGFWILQECQRFWAQRGEELDVDMMMHLASVADPFECLINPGAALFHAPGDMPQKIKAFCRDTGQPIPRKPGPIIRCVLESIALQFRKDLELIETITGRQLKRLFLLHGAGSARHALFDNFIANAIQRPVVVCPEETTAAGNILVQAVALRHIASLEEARRIGAPALRCETIQPYAGIWESAFEKLERLVE